MTIADFQSDVDRPASFGAGETLNRAWEFLLTGGGALILLPLFMLFFPTELSGSPQYLISMTAFYAAYVINDPHFAVSYLIFYRNFRGKAFGEALPPSERKLYRFVGIVAPLFLLTWMGVSLATQNLFMAGLMIHVMYIMVGWHYVKQGFGVLMTFASRRGYRFSSLERNAILAHCYAGWIYGWSMAMGEPGWFDEMGLGYWSAGIGYGAIQVLEWMFWSSGVIMAVIVGKRIIRTGQWPPLAGLSGLLVSIWLWVVYSDINDAFGYFIPALHSIQYFFFVGTLKFNQARDEEGQAVATGFLRPKVMIRLALFAATTLALGWVLFHGAPDALDRMADHDWGVLGGAAGMALFVAFVNIHHYMMDNVMWRRGNPDMQYLR